MKKVFLKCLKRVLFFVTKIVLKYFSIIDKAEKKNWILDGKKKQIRTVALEANSKTENSFSFKYYMHIKYYIHTYICIHYILYTYIHI